MKYKIPEENFGSLEKKLTRILNKCAKYGNAFRYERIGEHFEDVTVAEETGEVDWDGRPITKLIKYTVKFIDIDVEGTAQLNDWQYAASLEYTPQGNIIAGVAGMEIPERYYTSEPWCEHCQTKRDRKYSYIVYNTQSGEYKQVGKSCLADFTHGLSAEYAALCESFFKELEMSQQGFSGGYGKTYYKVDEYMTCVAETIRLYGYAKRDGYSTSTATRAEAIYKYSHNYRVNLSEEKLAKEAIANGYDATNTQSVELAKTVREWVIANEKNDNYMHNLKVACALECGDYTVIGLLASAFPTYDRELAHEAERRAKEAREAAERAQSTWMGAVGARVSFVISEFRTVTSWETMYGTTYIYKITDGAGHVATWKTSKCIFDERATGKTITGTIKELNEYRGVKQTELTRCKIA